MATLNFPDSPSTGDTYSDANSGFEYEWNGVVWISKDASTSGKRSNIQEIDDISGAFNGSTTDFILNVASNAIEPTNAQQVVISVGGVLQNSGDDYTIDGSTITFTTAPADGLTFFGTYVNPYLSSNAVADNTVSTGSLAASGNYTVGGINVTGVSTLSGLTYTGVSSISNLSSSNLAVTGVGTIANVIHTKDSSGLGATIGAAVGIVTYYGDASNLTGVGMTLFPYTYSPANGATSQGKATDIDTTWNSFIEAGSGTITIRTGSASGTIVDQFVVGTSNSITIAGNSLTLNPAADLDYDTTFYVVYPAGSIKALGGQHSNQEIITSFATEPQPRYLFVSGSGNRGRLGLNLPSNANRSSPTQVGTDGNWGWGYRSNGSGAFFHTKTDGTLWGWSYNNWGKLGLNQAEAVIADYSSPVQIGTDTTWGSDSFATGAIGSIHQAIIKTDGTLWSWGYNASGRLGLNTDATITAYSSPTQVGTDTTWAVSTNYTDYKISENKQGFLAVKTNGTLWTWGDNGVGQLGMNDTVLRSSPTQIGTDTTWKTVGYGGALKTDGTLWSWGYNLHGQLGQNDGVYRSSPTQVPGTWGNAILTGAGSGHKLIVKGDGTLWAWGSSGHTGRGLLGLNDSDIQRSSPTQVGTNTNWGQMMALGMGSRGMKTDGTNWSWGVTYQGTLGAPGFNQFPGDKISSPMQIGGTNFVDMSSMYVADGWIKSSTS